MRKEGRIWKDERKEGIALKAPKLRMGTRAYQSQLPTLQHHKLPLNEKASR